MAAPIPSPTSFVVAGLVIASGFVALVVVPTSPQPAPATVNAALAHSGFAEFPPMAPTSLRQAPESAPGAYYMQQGADISSIDGFTGGGFTAVYVELIAEQSPYSTGYELNGLSNTLDWYQAVFDYNWPGCLPGFDAGFEFFNDTGSSVAQFCWPVSNFAAGDLVELGLNFSGGNVCMSITNVGFGPTDAYCATQPNPGGTYFQLQPVGGFFTGPMTEIVDTAANSCLAYERVPRVDYHFVQGAYISSFTPWADEWNPAGQFVCWSHTASAAVQAPGDYSKTFFNDSGTPYLGPRWSMAENTSTGFSGWWWEYSTDDSPIQLTVGASATASTDVGGHVSLNGSSQIGGGALVYTYLQDGVPIASATSGVTWTPESAGSFQLVAEASYPNGTLLGASYPSGYSVFSDPIIGPVNISRPLSALDAGMNLAFSASASGGSGGYSYSWAGLPAGCVQIGSVATCPNLVAGVYSVEVMINDSNGFTANSTSYAFYVAPSLSIQLVSNTTAVVVGQRVSLWAFASGGSAPVSIQWAGLPTPCDTAAVANPSEVECSMSVIGNLTVRANATDAAGATATESLTIHVAAAAPPPDSSVSTAAMLRAFLANPFVAWALGFVVALLIGYALPGARRRRPRPDLEVRHPTGPWSPPANAAQAQATTGAGQEEPPPPAPGPYWLEHPLTKPLCNQCGQLNPPMSAYCSRCGIPLPLTSEAPSPPSHHSP